MPSTGRSFVIWPKSDGVPLVSPGVIRTPMHSSEILGFLAGLQPLGRVGETQDVIDAVMYLKKATFVTDEILHVDGGASARHW
jgi:NAD(P)-dependent dehydrogenase (short-subunit alcohol dehydrogenase family)